jgi:uncharacterized protein YbaP (TraB family)
VHVGKRQFYPLDPPIEDAFQKSRHAGARGRYQDKEKLLQSALGTSVYPPGDSIDKHHEPVVLTLLREYFVVNGVPFEPLRRLKPWILTLTVVAIEYKKAGYEA